jgi:hypothetical protein
MDIIGQLAAEETRRGVKENHFANVKYYLPR